MTDVTSVPLSPFSLPEADAAYDALLAQPLDDPSLPEWLGRWSDLEKRGREAFVILHRAVNADTADRDAAAGLAAFTRDVRPQLQRRTQELREKLLAQSFTPRPEWVAFLRRFRAESALYREENLPLEAEAAALGQEYTRREGSRTMLLEGQERPLHEGWPLLEHPDRARREEVWRAMATARNADAAELDDVFLKQLELRSQVARHAGVPSYTAYRWQQLGRLDYGPDDAAALADAVEHEVMPLLRRVAARRAAQLGTGTLRPWDLWAHPDTAPPLRPYPDAPALEVGVMQLMARIDPELGQVVADMRSGNLDLEARPDKVSTFWYCSHYPTTGRPYIMTTYDGTDSALSGTLHELGHACHHALACAAQPLVWNRPTPLHSGPSVNMEFNELASQALQLLALPYLSRQRGGPYDDEQLARSRTALLEGVLFQLAFIMMDDEFMRWVFSQESVTVDDMDAARLSLRRRFSVADESGLDDLLCKGWQSPFAFNSPLYAAEYAFAWLGALQVWQGALLDEAGAIERYKAAFRLGYTRPLPELYATAGAQLVWSREAVRALMQVVEEQLNPADPATAAN